MDHDFRKKKIEQGCEFEEIGEFANAIECYLVAAKLSNVEAQVNLGNLYYDGRGTKNTLKRPFIGIGKLVCFIQRRGF
jgi:TPR repeat protein